MPISGKPEIGGRRILRDGRYAMFALFGNVCTCALLRMRRINGQHLVIPIHFQRDAGGKTHVQTQVMSQNSLQRVTSVECLLASLQQRGEIKTSAVLRLHLQPGGLAEDIMNGASAA